MLLQAGDLQIRIDGLVGLDQVALRKAAGVSRQTINNIVNDRQTISRAMAGKLARITGRSSDYWLRASFPSESRVDHGTKFDPNSRSTGDRVLVNYQIKEAVRLGIIGLKPFNEANIRVASLELTLGDFVTTNEGIQIDVSRDESFILKSNSAVGASTKERIELPQDYLGRVGLVAGLARIGVLTSIALQVAPGFGGYLHFFILNSGRDNIELRGGMPIVNIEIVQLSAAPVLIDGAGKRSSRDRRR